MTKIDMTKLAREIRSLLHYAHRYGYRSGFIAGEAGLTCFTPDEVNDAGAAAVLHDQPHPEITKVFDVAKLS